MYLHAMLFKALLAQFAARVEGSPALFESVRENKQRSSQWLLKNHNRRGNARWRMGAEKCTMNVEKSRTQKRMYQILSVDEKSKGE